MNNISTERLSPDLYRNIRRASDFLERTDVIGMSKSQLFYEMYADIPLFSLVMFPHHITSSDGVPDFHREMYRLCINPNNRKLAFMVPRNHGKTTCIDLVYASHQILFRARRHIVIISETLSQAQDQLETLRSEFEENEIITTFFGDVTSKTNWQEEEVEDEYPKGQKTKITQKVLRVYLGDDERRKPIFTTIKARGYGQQIRGSKIRQYRPDLIIGDDLDGEKTVNTPEIRIKRRKQFLRAVVPALDSERGQIIVIANPVHDDCLIKVICDNSQLTGSDWITRVWRAGYYETKERKQDKTLWNARWPLKRLEEVRKDYLLADDPFGYDQEYECITVSEAERQFKVRNFWDGVVDCTEIPFMTITEENGHKVEHKTDDEHFIRCNIFAGCDPAIGQSEGSDYFAFSIIAITHDDNIYVVEYFAERGVTPDRIEQFYVDAARKYKRALIHIATEENGFQSLIAWNVTKRFRKEGLGCRLVPIKNIKNKILRISKLQPHNERGQLWIKPSMQALLYEMDSFPRGAHEHLLDSIEMAFRYRSQPSTRTVGEESVSRRKKLKRREVGTRFNYLHY